MPICLPGECDPSPKRCALVRAQLLVECRQPKVLFCLLDHSRENRPIGVKSRLRAQEPRACSGLHAINRMSALGHLATQTGHALISEKGSEPDIELRRLNDAEVPEAD
jgi:hypothetical protein